MVRGDRLEIKLWSFTTGELDNLQWHGNTTEGSIRLETSKSLIKSYVSYPELAEERRLGKLC